VDTNGSPNRPWHRRKGTWAAGILAMVIAYPLSLGPVWYAIGRGWVTYPDVEWYHRPYLAVVTGFENYEYWWESLGARHRDPSPPEPPSSN